jgi:hypothetical protein
LWLPWDPKPSHLNAAAVRTLSSMQAVRRPPAGRVYSGKSAANAPITVCSHARSSASARRILRRAQSETASRVPIAYSGPVTA